MRMLINFIVIAVTAGLFSYMLGLFIDPPLSTIISLPICFAIGYYGMSYLNKTPDQSR